MNTETFRRMVGTSLVVAALSVAPVAGVQAEGSAGQQAADAKSGEARADKIEKIGNGEINWTKMTLKVTGTGAPDLKAPNVAVARIGAERVAKLDALRNVLETLKGVQLSAGKSVGKSMEANSGLATSVQGKVKDWRVIDTRYYADGGVELDVEVKLDGEMGKLLLPDTGKDAAKVGQEDKPKDAAVAAFTGIIIDARGTGLVPALAPNVYDEAGNLVYGPTLVSPEAAADGGVAVYVASLDAAKSAPRAGQNPLLIKAAGVSKTAKSDLVVPAGEAAKLDDMGDVVVGGKLVIVAE